MYFLTCLLFFCLDTSHSWQHTLVSQEGLAGLYKQSEGGYFVFTPFTLSRSGLVVLTFVNFK